MDVMTLLSLVQDEFAGDINMSEIFVVFLAVLYVLVTAVFCHKFITNIIIASVGSSLISTILVFITIYVRTGFVGPFTYMALKNAFIILLIIGIPFLINRRRKEK